ncbi:MAG: hypothetical protein JXB17_02310, partial [Bacteroidales bacterium]|nr:hypothetical protein [Bacteroidales bacterium]
MDWLDNVFVDEMEKKIVLDKYVDLITNCKNCLTSQDKLLIQKAFELSVKTHKGQYIRKGYPYILHPIEVARIASDEIG